MKIYYLNGPRFLRAILAGSDSVINKTEYLNKINVFPVADNDPPVIAVRGHVSPLTGGWIRSQFNVVGNQLAWEIHDDHRTCGD